MKSASCKCIRIIRHGECHDNARGDFPRLSSRLTIRGRLQVYGLLVRFLFSGIDVVIHSSTIRSRETAEILAGFFRVPTVESSLFDERIRTETADGAVVLESFDALHKRCEEALRYVRLRKEGRIAVISHATFMKSMHLLLTDDKTDGNAFETYNDAVGIRNAAVMRLTMKGSGHQRIEYIPPPFFSKQRRSPLWSGRQNLDSQK